MMDLNYTCEPIEGVADELVPTMIKQFMAVRYMAAVPDLTQDEAMHAAVATWETPWMSDPTPRNFTLAEHAVDDDLECWDG